jgi:hypothetical protein
MAERPLCKCHGEQMLWHVSKRYRAGGYWYCAERNRETKRKRYENLSGFEYNRLLLRHSINTRTRNIERRKQQRESEQLDTSPLGELFPKLLAKHGLMPESAPPGARARKSPPA